MGCVLRSSERYVKDWNHVLKNTTILAINGISFYSTYEVQNDIKDAKDDDMKSFSLIVAPYKRVTKECVMKFLPQLQVDQLRHTRTCAIGAFL